VLAGLLAERVAINDLARIYEALALRAKTATDTPGLVEAARAALGPAIAARFAQDGRLRVVMFEPMLEQQMLEGMRVVEGQPQIVLSPEATMQLIESVRQTVTEIDPSGPDPVLVCAPSLRAAVRRMVAAQVRGLPVLSYDEAGAGGFATDVVGAVRIAPSALPIGN
jgi:flagellar biosynthesis protein FlhA